MNPYLQQILHDITIRLAKLEEQLPQLANENRLLHQGLDDVFKGLESTTALAKAQAERNNERP